MTAPTPTKHTKACTHCRQEKSVLSFNRGNGRQGRQSWCRDCHAENNNLVRRAALQAYGAVCQCCGENGEAFLTIDHVAGGGAAHRRSVGITTGLSTYLWLRRNKYPEGYQTLCWNCNAAKHFRGECPHEVRRKAAMNG